MINLRYNNYFESLTYDSGLYKVIVNNYNKDNIDKIIYYIIYNDDKNKDDNKNVF